ncbi:hypothetical protein [Natrinema gelatinilyticum]|uniref:hypothetical protein n=1 Tax=Natrinema gelatinilyticum TaxID=2961571 RepID=UPI0020C2D8AE|nr:hypothetical protein [Natrinema gelatinilyticum]
MNRSDSPNAWRTSNAVNAVQDSYSLGNRERYYDSDLTFSNATESETTPRSAEVHAFDDGFGIDPETDAVAALVDAIVLPDRSSDLLHAVLDSAADVRTLYTPGCSDCLLEGDCRKHGIAGDD